MKNIHIDITKNTRQLEALSTFNITLFDLSAVEPMVFFDPQYVSGDVQATAPIHHIVTQDMYHKYLNELRSMINIIKNGMNDERK